MLKKIRNSSVFMIITMLIISTLFGCDVDNTYDIEVEPSISVLDQISTTGVFIEDVAEENITETEGVTEVETVIETENDIEDNEDRIMYYDLEEIVIRGNKIASIDNKDYEISNLMPDVSYKKTGVKTYVYETECINGEGFVCPTYLFLIENNGKYQVYDDVVDVKFINASRGEGYDWNFEVGKEYDCDNDGEYELVDVVTTDVGTFMLGTKIIVFDFNRSTDKYEPYYISIDDYNSMVDKAARTFFDEYYDRYCVDEQGVYKFQNGYSVEYGNYVMTNIEDDGSFVVRVIVYGNPRDDGAMGNEIGTIEFKINYIGDGKFSVKAVSYLEW